MEDFSTLIYIAFIIISVVGGLIGKNKKSTSSPKKPQAPQTQKSFRNEKPTQEKSFQEMIDEMIKKYTPQQQPEYTEEAVSQEANYEFGKYESDSESLEEIIQDEDDHHNKNIQWLEVQDEKSLNLRFKVDNLQQAILVSEVLGKPKALQ